MGLLSWLAGLTELYEARFVFDRLVESDVEVEIEACRAFDNFSRQSGVSPQMAMILLAYGHWSKNLYNLGNHVSADYVNFEIETRADRIDLSMPLQRYFYGLPGPITPGIKWRTVLCQNRQGLLVPNTIVPVRGDPNIMAPPSILALFDCVMYSLDDQSWQGAFIAGLGAMVSFYEERGHTDIRFITAAPERGFAVAAMTKQMLDEQGDSSANPTGERSS